MATNYSIPQTMALDERQVANSAGGFSYAVDDEMRLLRYLILGSSAGSYYAKPQELTEENLAALLRLLAAGKGPEAVAIIREVSVSGRAPRQTPTLTALAVCAKRGDEATRKAAYAAVPAVCRIPTHLFEFLELCEAQAKANGGGTGWGRAHRRAVAGWYNEHRGASATALAMSVTKYQQRHGWAHLDALRLCHATPATDAHAAVFRYLAKGLADAQANAPAQPEGKGKKRALEEPVLNVSETALTEREAVLTFLGAVEEAKRLTSEDAGRCVELIRQHRLVREHVPSGLLGSVPVWSALLEQMPLTALIRSLGKLSSIGLVAPGSEAAAAVSARLTDAAALRKARVHPMAVLLAHKTYSAGRGDKGKLTWTPAPEVVAALDQAFELAFASVQPAGKRFMLALDVSGSMCASINGSGGWGTQPGELSCHEASAAMALIAMRTEPSCIPMCFSSRLQKLPLTKEMSLGEAVAATSGLSFGRTDCSLPMQYAMQNKLEVDTFIVYTDSETYHGRVHPTEALRQYRKASGIDARLIVVGMCSNGFTIADPEDAGMLDCVGFDSASPQVMSDFAAGRV